MADSPTKRVRQRRKEQKRREKKARRANRPIEDDPEAVAARYLQIPEDAEVETEGEGGADAENKA